MRALALCIALFLLSALSAFATDVLIVQTSRNPAYNEAVRGFKSGYQGVGRTILLSDYAEVDIARLVQEERPRIVLAVGDTALSVSRKLSRIPVVSLLTVSALKGPVGSVSGVGVLAAPEQYLNLCRAMGAKRVGVIYDPSRSGWYVGRAEETARRLGLNLVTRQVRRPQDTLQMLEQLNGKIDVLWLLPDATAVTSETLDAYFLFSISRNVPVVAYAEHYLGKGAAVVLDVPFQDLGRQAAELAGEILKTGSSQGEVMDAKKPRLHINDNVLKNLGIPRSSFAELGLEVRK